jgi:hypothetical protein
MLDIPKPTSHHSCQSQSNWACFGSLVPFAWLVVNVSGNAFYLLPTKSNRPYHSVLWFAMWTQH